MSNPIERPIFYEGQILGAADLAGVVEYHRGADARHNRYLHIWGIVSGLEGKANENASVKGAVDISIKPGVAIDGTGREIIVPEAEKLDENLFLRSNVALDNPDVYYPVFVSGTDAPAPQQPLSIGACSTQQPTRKVEASSITFGSPTDAVDVPAEESDVTAGPGTGWRVLIGFVKWDSTLNKFTAWSDEANGIRRRYAGVRADVVAARGGRLSLRASDAAGKPAVFVDETNNKAMLQFGMLTDQGTVTPVFSVSATGDVIAQGTIKGAVEPGSVQIQSGIITDGMVLPLPPGITEEQVANHQVALHVQLSPRAFGSSSPDPTLFDWVATPLECTLDSTTRRVLCRFRWFSLATPSTHYDVPGACNYLVMASVPADSGG